MGELGAVVVGSTADGRTRWAWRHRGAWVGAMGGVRPGQGFVGMTGVGSVDQ